MSGIKSGRRDSNLIENDCSEKTLGMVAGELKKDKNSPSPPSQSDLRAGDDGDRMLCPLWSEGGWWRQWLENPIVN